MLERITRGWLVEFGRPGPAEVCSYSQVPSSSGYPDATAMLLRGNSLRSLRQVVTEDVTDEAAIGPVSTQDISVEKHDAASVVIRGRYMGRRRSGNARRILPIIMICQSAIYGLHQGLTIICSVG